LSLLPTSLNGTSKTSSTTKTSTDRQRHTNEERDSCLERRCLLNRCGNNHRHRYKRSNSHGHSSKSRYYESNSRHRRRHRLLPTTPRPLPSRRPLPRIVPPHQSLILPPTCKQDHGNKVRLSLIRRSKGLRLYSNITFRYLGCPRHHGMTRCHIGRFHRFKSLTSHCRQRTWHSS